MPTVGAISSPLLNQSGDAIKNLNSANVTDLAQTVQSTNQSSRVTPTSKTGEIQELSREPRTTPPDVAKDITKESHDARVTPKEDQVTISNNARSARNPTPVQTGETVGNLNVENKLDIKV